MRKARYLNGSFPDAAVSGLRLPVFPESLLRVARLSTANGGPLVSYWLEPDSRYLGPGEGEADQGWFDCSSGVVFGRVGAGVLAQGDEINGGPTLAVPGATLRAEPGKAPVPETALSAFFVVKNEGTAGNNRYLLGDSSGTTLGTISVYLTPSGFSTYLGRGGSGAPVAHSAPDYLSETPKLLGVTFSTKNGVTLRRNGVEVLKSPSRTDPNPSGKDLIFFGSTGAAGRWNGRVGTTLFLSGVDLSDPSKAFELSEIESFLMNRYALEKGA